jgi:hypothetical protein
MDATAAAALAGAPASTDTETRPAAEEQQAEASMTLEELDQRAREIWGAAPMTLHRREDGGADVDVMVNVKGQPFYYHRLDGFGHAVCHGWCAQLEREAR